MRVINFYLNRAYHVSSNNKIFETELARIKQLLTNNNFPMYLIERAVFKFLATKNQPTSTEEKSETIDFYFSNQLTSQYRMDEIEADAKHERIHLTCCRKQSCKTDCVLQNTKAI